jgi:solute:Na+ symporter, SSS family
MVRWPSEAVDCQPVSTASEGHRTKPQISTGCGTEGDPALYQLPKVDIAVLVVYLVAVVAFGCWFVRRSRSTEGFMAAGRSLPGWAVGMSIFGTYLSSNTFIGVPGKAFGSNWNSFVFSLSLPIAALIAVRFFVPFYRRTGEISAYHHLEKRFGTWARVYAMTCYLLTQLARMGSIMFGVALALHALVGWDVTTIILITGVLVTVYTLLGGIEAVIWTDVAQSIVLLGGAITVAVMLLFAMPEGPSQIFTIATANPTGNKFSLGSFGPGISESTFWVVLVYGMVMNLTNFGIDQNFVQRYHTARSDREAAKSVWIGALVYLPVAALFFFIGTSLFAYYQTQPDMMEQVARGVAASDLAEEGITDDQPGYETLLASKAAELEPADIGDKVLPHFIVKKLPTGMAGLLIAAIFAAAMSSIDTSLNSSATIVLSDFYRRFFRPAAGERESMMVLYTTTLVIGTAGTAAAVAMIGVKSILDVWWMLSGILAGGMIGLFLLGMISRRAKSPAAVVGVLIGMLVILWMTFSSDWAAPWASPFHKFLIPVIGTTIIVLLGMLVGMLGEPFGKANRTDQADDQ